MFCLWPLSITPGCDNLCTDSKSEKFGTNF